MIGTEATPKGIGNYSLYLFAGEEMKKDKKIELSVITARELLRCEANGCQKSGSVKVEIWLCEECAKKFESDSMIPRRFTLTRGRRQYE